MPKKHISCSGMIFLDKRGNMLLEDRRKISKHGEGWSFFGGRKENKETKEETLKREIKEELGLDIKEYFFFKTYSFNLPKIELTYDMFCSKIPDLDKIKVHQRAGIGIFSLQEASLLDMTWMDKEIISEVGASFEEIRKKLFND